MIQFVVWGFIGVGLITAFATGIFLCLAYEKTGSLLTGIIIHAVNNAMSIIPFSETDDASKTDMPSQLIVSIIQLGVAIFIFYKLYRENNLKTQSCNS